MRERAHGRSSIGALASVYYMIKVLLAIFVDLFRRDVVPLEERHDSAREPRSSRDHRLGRCSCSSSSS